ncbi:MAG: YidC/Oxa1 family membrane protein insertase [Thermoleophilaceae bacterium]
MNLIALAPQFMIDVADSILKFFHNDVGLSWGLSIVALTMAVRLVILPLTFKQVKGMQELQAHAPELKKIQERYKDDSTRKNEETMKYYRENKVNPLSSCLPLVLQIPVFITLFALLRGDSFRSDIAGEESFLFISNLAEPSSGLVLITLMVLYVGTQLGASLVSMVSAEKTQRNIMLALPFVFVPVVISFQAGLIVYWITTNVWTLGQQLLVKRFMPNPALAAAKEEARTADKDGAGAKASANGAKARKAGSGGNGGRATATSGNGASRGNGNGGPAKAPPPSPRKKKKRSGRRR